MACRTPGSTSRLAFTGHGKATVADPVSTKGLRNLDGFGTPTVQDGRLTTTVDVDGAKRLRTVSDFDKQLPLTVSAIYLLDGEQVLPKDVVGRTGDLEVRYTVRNVTAKPQSVAYDDGTGKRVTKEVPVVIPMVGSLTTTLPAQFTDVASPQASVAGDGRGGTSLTFTMTLFGPIGAPEASFGYTARIRDGVVPAATVSALPVSPLDSPSFKGGAASLQVGCGHRRRASPAARARSTPTC
ncbi:hypothetical protein GCM10025868_02910 [Angustibacter aerolatus]|uniref:DUF11 domain-containing protein n=1 Tax=Angustibacter aerolatus TaxID=1162965 RepID=A0ABQ6JE36_9ACTN|nr:hypothetical protein [Angustibacter aerolatus]GMA85041.1 hypothetical protein GCM10025868_02910 [Angustibacter aerolatus]